MSENQFRLSHTSYYAWPTNKLTSFGRKNATRHSAFQGAKLFFSTWRQSVLSSKMRHLDPRRIFQQPTVVLQGKSRICYTCCARFSSCVSSTERQSEVLNCLNFLRQLACSGSNSRWVLTLQRGNLEREVKAYLLAPSTIAKF